MKEKYAFYYKRLRRYQDSDENTEKESSSKSKVKVGFLPLNPLKNGQQNRATLLRNELCSDDAHVSTHESNLFAANRVAVWFTVALEWRNVKPGFHMSSSYLRYTCRYCLRYRSDMRTEVAGNRGHVSLNHRYPFEVDSSSTSQAGRR